MKQFKNYILLIAFIFIPLALTPKAEAQSCENLLGQIFNLSDFASSKFGNLHAERPGNSAFSQWSVATANRLHKELKKGSSVEALFQIAAQARNDFALNHELVKNPTKEGYGVYRELITDKPLGEDNIGVSSITLSLEPAAKLGPDYTFPNKYWKGFASEPSRTEWANQALRALRDYHGGFTNLSPEILITDRHYQTLDLEVYRIGGTRIHKVLPELETSPYFVNTLNLTVKEIKIIFRDVQRRLEVALDKKLPQLEREEQLKTAMYAFFNAMPYYRGSAAIGRILFTVMAREIIGENVRIHSEIDVLAIINTEPGFMDQVIF